MEMKKKEKKKDTWILLNAAYEKKKKEKERTNIFFFLNRQYIDWKKEEKKTEHFWTVIVILFWLVVKWNFFSLFKFKGDIRIFFSCSYYEIWRRPLTEDFILGLLKFVIILILKLFFRIWGFRAIGNFFLGFCFDESVADVRVGQTFIHVDLQIVVG